MNSGSSNTLWWGETLPLKVTDLEILLLNDEAKYDHNNSYACSVTYILFTLVTVMSQHNTLNPNTYKNTGTNM